MHPKLSEQLVNLQLEECHAIGIFNATTRLKTFMYPILLVEFTTLTQRTRLLRFECDNYDFQPLAVDPVDPTTLQRLDSENWIKAIRGSFPGHPMRGGSPFICMSGLRDFYTHDSHRPQITGKRWESDRTCHRIRDILRVLSEKFSSGAWE